MNNTNAIRTQKADNSLLQVNRTQNMFIFEIIIILFYFSYDLLPVISTLMTFMEPLLLGLGYLAILFVLEPKWRPQILVFIAAVGIIAVMYYVLTDSPIISTSASNYGVNVIMATFNQYFMTFLPVCLFVRIYTKAS